MNTPLESTITIGPFEVQSDCKLLICVQCQFAVWPEDIQQHFRRIQHTGISHDSAYASSIANTVMLMADNGQVALDITSLAQPFTLATPVGCLKLYLDGQKCLFEQCSYITASLDAMRKHLQRAHNYRPYGTGNTGRPTHVSRSIQLNGGVDGTSVARFRNGVSYQRPFRINKGPRCVEVLDCSREPDIPSTPPSWLNSAGDILGKRRRDATTTIDSGGATDRHPWVEYVGVYQAFNGVDFVPLLQRIDKPCPQEEPSLYAIWNAFDDMFEVHHNNLASYGRLIRFAAGQGYAERRGGDKPLRQYQSQRSADYTRSWKQVLMFFARTYNVERHQQQDNTRPRYVLNSEQHTALCQMLHMARTTDHDQHDQLQTPMSADWEPNNQTIHASTYRRRARIVQSDSEDEASNSEDSETGRRSQPDPVTPMDRRQLLTRSTTSGLPRLCHLFCISLIRERDAVHEHEMPLVSAIRLLALGIYGITVSSAFNTKLCSMIKIARMMSLEAVWDENGANCLVPLRNAVSTWMVRGTGSPMEWMLDTSAYLLEINKKTTAEAGMEWNGDELRYHGIKLRVGQFTGMIHSILAQARAHIHNSVLFRIKTPSVPWDRFTEDVARRDQGQNFLDWSFDSQEERQWLVTHLKENACLASHLDCPTKRKQWLNAVEVLREHLLLLVYFTSGQPSRGTELLSISHRNNHSTEARGIFYIHGLIAVVSTYSKGVSKSGQCQVVYRFLPREVGELLVQYLWLVLPLYELVESNFMYEAHLNHVPLPPHIWPEHSICGKKWNSARVSELLSGVFQQRIGQPLGLRDTRQILIALGRHLILEPRCRFVDDNDHGDDDHDDCASDEFEAAFDHQAGHTTRTAQLTYARLLIDLPDSSERNRKRFLAVSTAWHQCLGFQLPDACGAGNPSQILLRDKANRKVWMDLRRHSRDLLTPLRKLYPGTQFRDGQEKQLTSIFNGESPVCIVAPTGAGKTVMYLLPAFCAPSTMTLVVVPLISLRSDLARRCSTAGLKAVEWDPRRQVFDANIVLVTPESLDGAELQSFLDMAMRQGRLYRIAIDEVHTVLTGGGSFRPAFRALKRLVQRGVRMLFLTATLPPYREATVWKWLGIDAESVVMHRLATRRANIRYTVRNLDTEGLVDAYAEIISAIHTVLSRRGRQKVIIYATTIARCEEVAEELDCAAYHSRSLDKQGLLDRFSNNPEGIICATSALSLGFHDPDVSDVVHVGIPHSLSDFLQESGRAGRQSDSVGFSLMLAAQSYNSRRGPQDDPENIDSYVDAHEPTVDVLCRRSVLDSVMDGHKDPLRCQPHEEQCDLCTETQGSTSSDVNIEPTLCSSSANSSRGLSESIGIEEGVAGSSRGGLSVDRLDLTCIRPDNRPYTSTDPAQFSSSVVLDSSTSPAVSNQVISDDTATTRSQNSTVPTTATPAFSTASAPSSGSKASRSALSEVPSSSSDPRTVDFDSQSSALVAASSRGNSIEISLRLIIESIKTGRQEWAERCVVCSLLKLRCDHRIDDCRHPVALSSQKSGRETKRGLTFVSYTCCFTCGLPQATCPTWAKAVVDNGSKDRPSLQPVMKQAYTKQALACQRYFAINFIYGACEAHEEIRKRWVERLSARGASYHDTAALRKYLVRPEGREFDTLTGLGFEFEWITAIVREVQEISAQSS